MSPKSIRTLTRKQRQLQNELHALAETIGMDYWNIQDREREARTPLLEVMKREMIRGAILSEYTVIDDTLGSKLCEYFFPHQSMIRLWKTKRFLRFNYYILERLSLVHKLAFVKDVYRVPKQIAATIEAINALRNSMAHAFFPENLRAYRGKGRPAPRKPIPVLYKGQDIFTRPGVQRFVDDCYDVHQFLFKIKRRKNQPNIAQLPKVI